MHPTDTFEALPPRKRVDIVMLWSTPKPREPTNLHLNATG